MAATATHVVAGAGCASRSGADVGSPAGPPLSAGQQVAVVAFAADGWAEAELVDGTRVWVEPGALAPLDGAVAPSTSSAAPASASAALSSASTSASLASAAASAIDSLPVTSGHHPPPPAPGAELPVKVAGIRLTTQLFSGALIIASALLPWTSQYFTSSSAFGVPLRTLIDPEPVGMPTTGVVKLAFVIVPLGVLVLIAGFRVLPPVVGQAAGAAAALVAILFVLQLQRVLGKFYAATVFGVLGIGVYLTLLGGVVAAMSKGGERA